jgi:hypothetical protein
MGVTTVQKTTTIYHRDGREQTVDVHEASRLVGTGTIGADKEWSLHKPPPLNWERETPRYRVTRDLCPAERARYRSEPPFGTVFNSEIWQYAERAYRGRRDNRIQRMAAPVFYAAQLRRGKGAGIFQHPDEIADDNLALVR